MNNFGPTLSMLMTAGEITHSGVPGVYVQGEKFARLLEAIDEMLVSAERLDSFESFVVPPQIPKSVVVANKYDAHFPELLAEVSIPGRCGCGNTEHSNPSEPLALVPAVCHHLYPLLAERSCREGGATGLFTMRGAAFRAEPSRESKRWQSFSVREWVCVDSEENVTAFAERWTRRFREILSRLGLHGRIVPATDPFTGPTGRIMRVRQLQTSEKLELISPLDGLDCAIASLNRHGTHFTEPWGLFYEDGTPAVSACVAFGLERVALALVDRHGLNYALKVSELAVEGRDFE
jgi:seryl-tRNA synthetase